MEQAPRDQLAPLQLCPTAVPRVLAGVSIGLVLAHVAIQTFHYRVHELPWLFTSLFDVDEEQSFPTWFSSVLLAIAGVLLLASARVAESRHDRFSSHWYGLAFGFALLSIDEVAGLHETLNALTDASWTGPAALGVGVVGLVYLPFLCALPSRTRWALMAAGMVYLGGALGVERLSDFWVDAYDMDNLGYQVWTAAEEGLEMIGVVWGIRAILVHLAQTLPRRVSLVQLGGPSPTRAAERCDPRSGADARPGGDWEAETVPRLPDGSPAPRL
ncbi:MAG: hypothetical protein ACE5IL_01285 [Myxococcota bacterium]